MVRIYGFGGITHFDGSPMGRGYTVRLDGLLSIFFRFLQWYWWPTAKEHGHSDYPFFISRPFA